jgi:CheY-like chemotaxis protein
LKEGAGDMAGKVRVLMVDDEEQFRSTTSKILTRKGYETTMAGSGEEAIEILRKSPQDVVILDIKMPGMDGHQTLVEIKKLAPGLPVIMLTGHGAMESAKESLKGGAYDYLSKPCDIDVLAAKINDAHSGVKRDVKEEKKAGDIMIPLAAYTTVDTESTIKQAIDKLKESYETCLSTGKLMETGHRSIVVFDRGGDLAGILSILDLIAAVRPAYLSAPKPSMASSHHRRGREPHGSGGHDVHLEGEKALRHTERESRGHCEGTGNLFRNCRHCPGNPIGGRCANPINLHRK